MIFRLTFVLIVLAMPTGAVAKLRPLSEQAMSDVTGREFFVAEHIDGNAADNNPDNYNQFDYYRLMLNANLEINANIERMQLGCGGINDALDPSVCDIDMEHVRLMGRSGPEGASAGSVGSLFELTRPYVEFAIDNDDSKTMREVVGIKIGAQSADGFMGVGRYNEDAAGCDPDATQGSGELSCHSGINALSGYLNTEMSATVQAETNLGTLQNCFGNTTDVQETNDCGPADTFVTQLIGTRMKNITLLNKRLKGSVLGLDVTAHTDLFAALELIHGFALRDTSDFALSFQRERVLYPDYQGNFPSITEDGGNGYDYPDYPGAPANTGWWFNVPYAAVINADANPDISGNLGEALGEGVNAIHTDFGQRPPDNCYGTAEFC